MLQYSSVHTHTHTQTYDMRRQQHYIVK